MSVLDQEVGLVQNPAYGALLLASFANGYTESHPEHNGVPLPYLFVALPLLLNRDFLDVIEGTRLGLRKFAEKFMSGEQGTTDLLLSINKRAIESRPLTLESIEMMLLSGLGDLNPETGNVRPNRIVGLGGNRDLPKTADLAHRLGGWFSELSLFEIGTILKVAF
jgi:hypothetical protein